MASYKLSKAADHDFERIFDFGIDVFGIERARTYQKKMTERFVNISTHPKQYPKVDYILPHHRRSIFGAHSIYFRIRDTDVLITRILGRERVEDLK